MSDLELFPVLLGNDPQIRNLRQRVDHLLTQIASAPRPPGVLLIGERGTGKSLLARLLHRAGPRRDHPFVVMDCTSLMPEPLLENELFGVARGAVIGTRKSKAGLFEEADGGTLFIDDIDRLPAALQPKLLESVETRSVRRLDDTRREGVDVWLIIENSISNGYAARIGTGVRFP